MKRGFVHGASEKSGEHPTDKPVKSDLAATMYHLLGIHSETMVRDVIGRDAPISYGKAIHDIIA